LDFLRRGAIFPAQAVFPLPSVSPDFVTAGFAFRE
jgi:hypothetical protein